MPRSMGGPKYTGLMRKDEMGEEADYERAVRKH